MDQWIIVYRGEYNTSLYGPFSTQGEAEDFVRGHFRRYYKRHLRLSMPPTVVPDPNGPLDAILAFYNPEDDIGATNLSIEVLQPPSDWYTEED